MKFSFSVDSAMTIEMDILEMEDHYPISNLNIEYRLYLWNDSCIFNRNVWMYNIDLIQFAKNILISSNLILKDMVSEKLIAIKLSNQETYQIELINNLNFSEANLNLTYSAPFTRDELSVFHARFKEFLEYYNIM